MTSARGSGRGGSAGLRVHGWLKVGMFPLILAVLERDYSRGYYNPYSGLLVSFGGNIPMEPQAPPTNYGDPGMLALMRLPTTPGWEALLFRRALFQADVGVM